MNDEVKIRSTTIVAIRKGTKGVIAGDGQVTLGSHVFKATAQKVRKLDKGVIAGFAGSAADALTLLERLNIKLSKTPNLRMACIALAKDWRTDRILQKLEAMLLVMDKESLFLLSGNGDVIQPEDGLAAIGSGGFIALTAAKVLMEYEEDAVFIAKKALKIAGEICIYTNEAFSHEVIEIGHDSNANITKQSSGI